MKLNVILSDRKKGQEITLPENVFNRKIHYKLINYSFHQELLAKRLGTASTKSRGEVQGSTRKPWKQKGTGRARAGSIRSPLWKGGGIVFGPKPRTFHSSVPKKMKRLSIVSSLSYFFQKNCISIIEDINKPYTKTKDFFHDFYPLTLASEKFKDYKNNKLRHHLRFYRLVFIVDQNEKEKSYLRKVSKNLPWIKCLNYNRLNVYNLATSTELVIEKSTLQKLSDFYKNLI